MPSAGEIPKGVMARTEPPYDKTKPVPRLGGHPDLTGNYQYSDWIGNYMTGGGRRCAPYQEEGCTRDVNHELVQPWWFNPGACMLAYVCECEFFAAFALQFDQIVPSGALLDLGNDIGTRLRVGIV